MGKLEEKATEVTTESNAQFDWVANPEGIRETYTNYTHASWSLYEVRILFGLLKPEIGNSSKFVVQERAAVSISWPHLKQLHHLLGDLLKSHESVNGEIARPKLTPRPGEIEK